MVRPRTPLPLSTNLTSFASYEYGLVHNQTKVTETDGSTTTWIFYWYSSVQKTKEMKRLTIVTNSGNVFPIVFDDQAFLSRVVAIMTDIIRDPEHARNITINVKDCTFSDDAAIVGNMYQP